LTRRKASFGDTQGNGLQGFSEDGRTIWKHSGKTFGRDCACCSRALVFSAVAVLSLALGIGANTTIFTVVNAILLHPLPVKDISQVVELDTIDTKTKVGLPTPRSSECPFRIVRTIRSRRKFFSGLSCIVTTALTWSGGAEPRQVNGQLVSANYFEVLGLQPVAGRFFLPEEDTKLNGNTVAVISHSFLGQ